MPAPSNISKADLEKFILIGIAALILIFGLIQFGIAPSLGKLSKLNKEIAGDREKFKKDQALIAGKSQLQSRLASMEGRLKKAEKAIPPHSEMPNILQGITNIAYESKVKIIKLEPLRTSGKQEESSKAKVLPPAKPGAKPEASKKPPAIYMEIPIQVEARGGYHSLGEFINRVESSGNIMSIGDIEIKANPDDIQNHNARLLIVAYVLREETPSK